MIKIEKARINWPRLAANDDQLNANNIMLMDSE
jgi:hypothetical protein